MLSDIEIAQGCQMRPSTEVAAAAGLDADYPLERDDLHVCDERSDRTHGRRPAGGQKAVLGSVCRRCRAYDCGADGAAVFSVRRRRR